MHGPPPVEQRRSSREPAQVVRGNSYQRLAPTCVRLPLAAPPLASSMAVLSQEGLPAKAADPDQSALALAVRSRSAATQASADRRDTRERKRELGQDKREHAQDLFASEYVWEPVDPTSFTGFDVRTYFGFYSELRSVFALAR